MLLFSRHREELLTHPSLSSHIQRTAQSPVRTMASRLLGARWLSITSAHSESAGISIDLLDNIFDGSYMYITQAVIIRNDAYRVYFMVGLERVIVSILSGNFLSLLKAAGINSFCPSVIMVTWIQVNIGPGSGLLPVGIKPLPPPQLTYYQ